MRGVISEGLLSKNRRWRDGALFQHEGRRPVAILWGSGLRRCARENGLCGASYLSFLAVALASSERI